MQLKEQKPQTKSIDDQNSHPNLSPNSAPVEKRTKWERESSDVEVKPATRIALCDTWGG